MARDKKLSVAQLIEILQRCPQDAQVFVAYDSLVCRRRLTEKQMFVVDAESDWGSPGVYLCAMGGDEIAYYLGEDKKQPCDDGPPGRRP